MKYLKSYNESIRDKMIPKPKEEINKIIGDISSLSYKSLPKDYLEESSAVGSFDASYNDLVKMFGEPLYHDWSWKTTMEWFIKDKDGRIYRIYDWKVAEWANIEFDDNNTIDEMKEKVQNYIKKQDTFHWMIGGVSADGVDDLKKYILYHTLNESIRGKMTPITKEQEKKLETAELTEQFIDESIRAGYLEGVKRWFNEWKPDDFMLYTFLEDAIYYSQLDIVKYLLNEQPIKVDPQTGIELRIATRNSTLDVVKYLIEEQGLPIDLDNNVALMEAIEGGKLETVKYLIENQPKPLKKLPTSLKMINPNAYKDILPYLDSKGIEYEGNRLLESIRNKMTPKSKEEINKNLENLLNRLIQKSYDEGYPKENNFVVNFWNSRKDEIYRMAKDKWLNNDDEIYDNYRTDLDEYFSKITTNESIRDKMTPKSKEEILKDLDYDPDVSYKPTKKSMVGTWLIGEYVTDYDTLVELFGEPEKNDWIGNNFLWKLITNNDRIVTIYDNNSGLETDELMNKEYKWHIGGTDPQDANNLIAYIIRNTK